MEHIPDILYNKIKYIHDYFSNLTFLDKKLYYETKKFKLEDIYDDSLLLASEKTITLWFYDNTTLPKITCYIRFFPKNRNEINDITSRDDIIYLIKIQNNDNYNIDYWETYVVIKKNRVIKFYSPKTGYQIYTHLPNRYIRRKTLELKKLIPILDLNPIHN